MKKCLLFVMVMVFVSGYAWAGDRDNLLILRYETGETELGEKFSGNYTFFENNSIDRLALGGRFVSGEEGFKLIQPHAFYRVFDGLWLGGKLSWDFEDEYSSGPAVRFGKAFWKLFLFMEALYLFDYIGDSDMLDVFASVSTAEKIGWYYGVEVWYYDIEDVVECFKLRPLKVGYRFENGFGPFGMIQRSWENVEGMKGSARSDSVLVGIEYRF